jgi:hypothetical protein
LLLFTSRVLVKKFYSGQSVAIGTRPFVGDGVATTIKSFGTVSRIGFNESVSIAKHAVSKYSLVHKTSTNKSSYSLRESQATR